MNIHQNHKFIISIVILLLWIFNYQICELLYDNDLKRWWSIKQSIYNICIAMSIGLVSAEAKGYFKIFLEFITGLVLSSVIDRIFFNTKYYTISDITMVCVNLLYATYNLIKYRKCLKKHRKTC